MVALRVARALLEYHQQQRLQGVQVGRQGVPVRALQLRAERDGAGPSAGRARGAGALAVPSVQARTLGARARTGSPHETRETASSLIAQPCLLNRGQTQPRLVTKKLSPLDGVEGGS